MIPPDRTALVVLGMHRGGTSAFTGTAVRLGLAGPKTPMVPAEDNPAGYYESVPLMLMNHHILLFAKCAWNLCLHFEPAQLDAMLPASDRAPLREALRHEFGDTADFVFKDPRLCLTLPVWLPELRQMAARVRVLMVLRHPLEVAQSLERRSQVKPEDAAGLWLHHMLEAEQASRGMARAVARYDDLLRGWRGCMARAGQVMDLAWPVPIGQAAAEVDAFLAAESRHHKASEASAVIGPEPVREMVDGAWMALRQLEVAPEAPGPVASLDDIRDRFAAWRRKMFPPGYHVVFDSA